MSSEQKQVQTFELEMEPAKLVNLLDLTSLAGAIESIRLVFQTDGLTVYGMTNTRVTGVVGKFNPKYFITYNSEIGMVDLRTAGLLERIKKSFKTDQKIQIIISKDRIVLKGKLETYDENLQANPPEPYKPKIVELGQRGYELTTAKTATQYKVDGGEIKDLSGEEIIISFGNGEMNAEIKSEVSTYKRTIKAKNATNSETKGTVTLEGDSLSTATGKLNTEVWITFTEGPGPTLFSMLLPDYTVTYFVAPKS